MLLQPKRAGRISFQFGERCAPLAQPTMRARVVRSDKPTGWRYTHGFVVCVIVGAILATIFSGVAAVLYLARGVRSNEVHDISLAASVAGYFAGFLAAGVMAGLLNPLAKTRLGAVFLGIFSTLPVALSGLFLFEGTFTPRDGAQIFSVLAFVLGFGAPVGYLAWREFVATRSS